MKIMQTAVFSRVPEDEPATAGPPRTVITPRVRERLRSGASGVRPTYAAVIDFKAWLAGGRFACRSRDPYLTAALVQLRRRSRSRIRRPGPLTHHEGFAPRSAVNMPRGCKVGACPRAFD